MTKKIFYTILLISILTSGFIISRTLYHKKEPYKVETNVFKTEKGWGYNILINNKIYIHQELIPAVNGNQLFQSKEDAQKTGILILNKIKKGEMPIIKISDLDSLKVKYLVF